MPAFGLITAAIGAGTAIYTIARNAQQQKKAKAEAAAALQNRPTYQVSPAIAAYLAETQGRVGAVDPAVTAGYQQQQQAAANRVAAAQRSASSGAEALAVGAHSQGMLNQAAPALIGQQQQYDANNRSNYYNALGAMSQQDQMVAQDRHGQYADNLNYQLGLAGAANQNIGQGIGLLGTSLASAGNTWSAYKNPNAGSIYRTAP